MTSRREGFGLAVAESLAVGTPVVTYDVDYGPAELVSDRVNGRVVADGSVEELAAALVEVLGDREVWNRMSLAAPAAAERLQPDVVAAQWIDLAGEVAAGIELPPRALLVEDLRVRRGGLDVEGVAIGSDSLPGWVSIAGGDEVPLVATKPPLPGATGPGVATGSLARDARATLPWSTVAGWPDAAALTSRNADSTSVPVLGPGLPLTVSPTVAGPVLLGWDEQEGVVRRVTGPDPIPVTARLTSVRAAVGEDVTVLSELPIARARVTAGREASMSVEVALLRRACPHSGLRARRRRRNQGRGRPGGSAS